jgi:hypothetical protein
MGSSTADLNFPLLFPPTLISATPSTGLIAGGDTITLAGLNFRPGATVLFGATAATVVTTTSTAIVVTSPAHAAGAVNVTVTNPDGSLSTLANGFTYFSLLIPDDAGTIFHLYVRNGQIADLFGNTITVVGVPSLVPSTAMGFPNGKSAEGIAGFSSSNYLSIATPLLNFAGAFFITAVVKSGSGTGTRKFILAAFSGVGTSSTARGYDIRFSAGPPITRTESPFIWNLGGSVGIGRNYPVSAPDVIHIFSGGLDSGLATARKISNLDIVGAFDNGALGFALAVGTLPARIGYGSQTPDPGGNASQPFDGTIFELRATTTPPTVALLNALHASIRNDP